MRDTDSSVPLEVPWVFDATWIVWGYLRFANPKPQPANSKVLNIGWAWTPELATWIETGKGIVNIDGLGCIPGLTQKEVLAAGAERLHQISWGLAGRYRKVLLGLIENE
jgi:hypothetical protein